MKRIFIALLLLSCFAANATNYYVSNTGSDANNGTSTATAWQTLSRVKTAGNNGTILAGDNIYFKKGDNFIGGMYWSTLFGNTAVSGTAGNPITFSSYGTGAKPIFQVTPNANLGVSMLSFVGVNYITIDGFNITDLSFPLGDKVNKAYCGNGLELGSYNQIKSNNCIVKNCTFSNIGAPVVIIGNFNTVDSCSMTDLKNIVNTLGTAGQPNTFIDDYGANGITITGNDNTVTHSYFSGNWASSYDFGYNGGAFEMFDSCSRNKFLYNTITDCGGVAEFGAAVANAIATDNLFAYNKIINCGLINWCNLTGSYTTNVNNTQYFNNVIIENTLSRFSGPNNGAGVTTNPPATLQSFSYNGSPSTTVYNLKNNIFQLSSGINVLSTYAVPKTTHANNIYKLSNGGVTNFTPAASELQTSVAMFANTTASDATVWDFNMIAGSPAIAFGQSVSLTPDFAGIAVATPPNAGVYDTRPATSSVRTRLLMYFDPNTGRAGKPLLDTVVTASNGIKKSGADFQIEGRLNAVSDFANFTGSTSVVDVADSLRGGRFLLYTGFDTADNGMVFKDQLNRKWRRVTDGSGIVNVRWYGASAALSNIGARVDTRNLFIAARDYIYNHPSKFTTLYIPADTSGLYLISSAGRYYISDSILFNKSIKILGDGTIGYPSSKIVFPPSTTGLIFKSTGQYGFSVDIQNLGISNDYNPPFNVKKHAITTQVLSHFNNINIEQFDGDGIHITACAIWPGGDNNNYGNAGSSTLENITALSCTNGIFIEGCDANTISIYNSNTSQNRRWGVFDNGMLGNFYTKPHCAFNGVPAVAGNAVVTYAGKWWAAIPGHDGYFQDAIDSNFNKQPDISPLFWYEVASMSSTVWNATTRYYSGGPINIQNSNSWSNIVGSYTEGFQPPINLNSRSKVDGGDNGAGVVNGAYHQILFGAEYLYNADLILPNKDKQHRLNIGEAAADFSTVLKIYNDYSKSITTVPLKIEGTNNSAYIDIKNNSGTSATFGYSLTDFVTYVSNTLISKQNLSGLFPGADNTFDLGSTSARWKDMYATTYHGNGGLLTGIEPYLGLPSTNGYVLSSTTAGLRSWVPNGAASQWITNGTAIHYPIGRVGVNTTTPISRFNVQDTNLVVTQNDTTGIMLSNTAPATAAVPVRIPPALVFKYTTWNAANIDTRWRLQPATNNSFPNFVMQRSINGGASYSDALTLSEDVGGYSIALGSSGTSYGYSANLGGNLNSGSVSTNSIVVGSTTSNVPYSNSFFKNSTIIQENTGANVINSFGAEPNISISSPTAGNIVRGFYYNPILSSLTNTKHYGFWNTTGDNLLGTTSGSTGIGATTTIAASAILQVTSTTQGVLIPQMTTTQRDAIATPATGLNVYNITSNSNNTYDGVSWKQQSFWGYTATAAAYTALTTDYTIDCTAGTFTVTLPTAVGISGKIYLVKNSGTGVITVATTNSQALDGATTKVYNTQYSGGSFQSNGAKWIITGNF